MPPAQPPPGNSPTRPAPGHTTGPCPISCSWSCWRPYCTPFTSHHRRRAPHHGGAVPPISARLARGSDRARGLLSGAAAANLAAIRPSSAAVVASTRSAIWRAKFRQVIRQVKRGSAWVARPQTYHTSYDLAQPPLTSRNLALGFSTP